MIEGYFQAAADAVALAVDAVAVLIVALGALEAAFHSLQYVLSRSSTVEIRAVWLRFAGWILLALEFSLGADVVNTAIAPSWDAIGKLGAIAVIRTALSFFLARDFKEARSLTPPPGDATSES